MPPRPRIRAQDSCYPGEAALDELVEGRRASRCFSRPERRLNRSWPPGTEPGHRRARPPGRRHRGCGAPHGFIPPSTEGGILRPGWADLPTDSRARWRVPLDRRIPFSEGSDHDLGEGRRRGNPVRLRGDKVAPLGLVPAVPARDPPRPGLRAEDRGRRGPGRPRPGEGPASGLPALSVGPWRGAPAEHADNPLGRDRGWRVAAELRSFLRILPMVVPTPRGPCGFRGVVQGSDYRGDPPRVRPRGALRKEGSLRTSRDAPEARKG